MNVTDAPEAGLPPQTFVAVGVFSAAGLLAALLLFQRYGSWRRMSLYVVVAGGPSFACFLFVCLFVCLFVVCLFVCLFLCLFGRPSLTALQCWWAGGRPASSSSSSPWT